MRLQAYLTQWKQAATDFLTGHNMTLESVTTGRDAWAIAHRSGIAREAYDISRDITDAHIQTALERIFPNAVFVDRKAY